QELVTPPAVQLQSAPSPPGWQSTATSPTPEHVPVHWQASPVPAQDSSLQLPPPTPRPPPAPLVPAPPAPTKPPVLDAPTPEALDPPAPETPRTSPPPVPPASGHGPSKTTAPP